jgi:quercetin dioxygenase-like cupin family protein
MKTARSIAVAALIAATGLAATGLALPPVQAQDNTLGGLKRTELLPPHDVSVPGREISQSLVEFGPGATAPRHFHPGEELIYVVAGTLEYDLEGQPPAVVKTGQSLLIPYGVVHGVKNVGNGNAIELGTYIAEKGKPLITLAK